MTWLFDTRAKAACGDVNHKARDAEERREAARDELRHANDRLRSCLGELLMRLKEDNSHGSA